MNHFALPQVAAVAVALSVLAGAPAFAQDADQATISQVRQSVRGALAPSSSWTDVAAGSRVKAGDTLKTPDDSAAELLFGSGARLTMGANTILRLQDLEGLGARVMAGRVKLVAPPRGDTTIIAGPLRVTGQDGEAVIERVGGNWRVVALAGTFQVQAAGQANGVSVEAGRAVQFVGTQAQAALLTRTMSQDVQQGFGFDMRGGSDAVSAPETRVVMSNGAEPWVAVGLSVLLPGVGQLYAGQVPRGLLYLGANCALIGAGAYGRFFGQTNLALGSAAGLLGLNLLAPLDALITTPAPTAPAATTGGLPFPGPAFTVDSAR